MGNAIDPRAVLIIRSAKPESAAVCDQAVQAAEAEGFRCTSCSLEELSDPLAGAYGLMVAIGGDGTILKAAACAAEQGIPVLGVNLGRIGFLSEISPAVIPEAFRRLAEGTVRIEDRMMLRCCINDQPLIYHCLNDMLLYKRSFSGVAYIGIEVNGLAAGDVFCDGLIVSTPTGATGYSISAGGPIIAPELAAAIITPVCPHSLHMRPIVAEPDARIALVMRSVGSLYADGRPVAELAEGDRVSITRADITARFVRLEEQNLYELIHRKLT